MQRVKENYKYLLLMLIVLLLPFTSVGNADSINAKEINDSTLGYYQSNTCKISLLEVISKNLTNTNKLYINNNDYVGLECFGKVSGLDKVGDTFSVSIGTNTTLSSVLQSALWLLVIFIFSKKRDSKVKLSYLPVLAIPLLFTVQHISEGRFYSEINKYYNSSLQIDNYYLLSYLLLFLLISQNIKDLFENRQFNILYFLPFMYLFPFTFMGMNLNMYLIIFSFFGIQSILLKRTSRNFNYFYLIFTFVWIINKKETINFFDTDKLRGFVNSSNNLTSTFFWITIFYLLVNGVLFLLSYEKNTYLLKDIKNSFLISGSLITALGLLGSISPILNFFNFYIFGQNKRGMKNLESVAGNTWRGFASSAEFIGEFFAICLLILIYYYLSSSNKMLTKDLVFSSICVFGLYKSNNFAAIISLIILSIFLVMKFKYKFSITKKQTVSFVLIILFIFGGLLNFLNYENLSSALLEEAILHSDLFQYSDNYKNFLYKEKYFEENDYKSLMNVENNFLRASSSLLFLIKTMTSNIDIPLIPNIVALVSAISLLINRTEMWGIFIAKYNPDFIDTIFGYGPFQMSNYLYDHRVRLDVPDYKLDMLFLPHSSYLDSIIFFGLGGLSIFLIYCGINLYRKNYSKTIFLYIFILLVINLLKSDSLLYIPTFTIFISIFYKTFIEKVKSNEEI